MVTMSAMRRMRRIATPVRNQVRSAFSILPLLKAKPVSAFGAGIIVFFFLLSGAIYFFGQFFLPFNPRAIDLSAELQPPSLVHPFGTDQLGSDLFRQVLYATPIDMFVPLTIVIVALFVGAVIGTVAALRGGWADELLMRITDVFRAFPALVLALAIAAALGSNIINAMLALMIVWWPAYARIARGEALALNTKEYVKFSKITGVSQKRIIFTHIFPNITPILIAYATADIGTVLILFSVLGYLGLGAQVPTPEWGRIVFTGQDFIQQAWWYPIFPAIMIFVVVMGFSLLGDGLRDLLDPRIKSTR
jgi:peptide/nickel transport system permease protein